MGHVMSELSEWMRATDPYVGAHAKDRAYPPTLTMKGCYAVCTTLSEPLTQAPDL